MKEESNALSSLKARKLVASRPRKPDYFDLLRQQMSKCHSAALWLLSGIEDGELGEQALAKDLFALEQDAEEYNYMMRECLAVEFISPLDRNDIIALTDEISRVSNLLREVAASAYMYGFSAADNQMIEIARSAVLSLEELSCVFMDFEHYSKKRQEMSEHFHRVRLHKRESDVVYVLAVKRLYDEDSQVHGDERQVVLSMYEKLNAIMASVRSLSDLTEKVMVGNM